MFLFNQKYRELPKNAPYINQVFKEYLASCTDSVDMQYCREICEEAKRYGLWIYNGRGKTWSSPDEFSDGIWNYKMVDKIHYTEIEFKDPLEGVIAGHQLLSNKIERLLKLIENKDQSCLKKLDEIRYYQIKLHQLVKRVIENDRREN